MKKESIFKVITLLFPIILIFLIELILRISGYGVDYQLFRRVKVNNRPDYLLMNPKYGEKYFKDKGFKPDNQSDLFLEEKTDSTFRIFVQGASTAVGFPFYYSGSFPRMLEHRLVQTFPDKNIEVINTGITAVNSYTLWDLTDKIIEQKPDLVLIYAGHNEYYGALGVGSSVAVANYPWMVRTYLWLKDFRFFQLLENGYLKLNSANNDAPQIGKTTLMEVMAEKQKIPINSDVYYAGLKQFESNVSRILDKYKSNNIPVILSTLVSNEKDIKPFISENVEDSLKLIEGIEENRAEANSLAEKNAFAAYIKGQYYLEKNSATSKKYFHLAKEMDYLRFRAPERINALIKSLAKENGIPLINMEQEFLKYTGKNVVGNELLTEHVHPNIKGYFVMADAFYKKIKELELLKDWQNYISFEEAINDIPVTLIDSIRGSFIIEKLKKSWPYRLNTAGKNTVSEYYSIQELTYEEEKAREIIIDNYLWREVMENSYYIYKNTGRFKEALRVAQSLILEYPEKNGFLKLAGEMCVKLRDYKKAAYYFFKFNKSERTANSAKLLASAYIQLDKAGLAYKTLLEAKKVVIDDSELNEMLGEVSEMIELPDN